MPGYVAGPLTDKGHIAREHICRGRGDAFEDIQIIMSSRHVPIFHSNLKHPWHAISRDLLDSASPLEQYEEQDHLPCISSHAGHYFLLPLKPFSECTRGSGTFAWDPLTAGCHVKMFTKIKCMIHFSSALVRNGRWENGRAIMALP